MLKQARTHLTSADDVSLCGQQVHHFSFAFVSPLRPEHHGHFVARFCPRSFCPSGGVFGVVVVVPWAARWHSYWPEHQQLSQSRGQRLRAPLNEKDSRMRSDPPTCLLYETSQRKNSTKVDLTEAPKQAQFTSLNSEKVYHFKKCNKNPYE